MALESATYITDLVPSNPDGSDAVSQGDDHLRLIKSVLQNTFPRGNGPQAVEHIITAAATQTPGVDDSGAHYLVDSSSGDVTIELPDSSSVAIMPGYYLTMTKKSSDTNKGVFAVQGSDSVKGGASLAITYPWTYLTVEYLGSTIWRVTDYSKLGQVADYLGGVVPAGAIFAKGTVGNAGATATFAALDYEGIYHLLWRSLADSEAPVIGGRGLSAAADWTANKAITIPDFSGRACYMREASATRITTGGSGLDSTTRGKGGGVESVVLDLTMIPSHNHGGTTGDDSPDHTHNYTGVGGTGNQVTHNDPLFNLVTATTSGASNRHQHSIAPAGGGLLHTNLSPAIIVDKILYVS